MRKGIQEIAAGNISYQIPIDGLHGENKKFALLINGIGTGLNKAVAEAMKNERLKTDLITNVSHDIKTPLTSILNYVGILRQTDPADPKVQDYLNILEEKAQRLKTLTEDVVEASKVSSGNISLEYMDLDLSEMISRRRVNSKKNSRREIWQSSQIFRQNRLLCMLMEEECGVFWKIFTEMQPSTQCLEPEFTRL